MLVYALSTARAGSKSVKNKNTMMIKGEQLYYHNILESMKCPEILDTYITTDIVSVIERGPKEGFKVIVRPDELCQDHSTHTDTIKHGLEQIEEDIGKELDILVVMLGNTMNMDKDVVREGLEVLKEDPEVDSVVTVIKANHFNPIRAYVDKGNGELETYMSQEQIIEKTKNVSLADKNSIGDIYFQNGLWILRRKTIVDSDGLEPFPWFGSRIKYIIQDPRLQEIDDEYQIKLLE